MRPPTRHHSTGWHTRGAFTLVELLAVIACIALLAGLLLPSLSRARGSAKSAQCTSNLRQLGLAAHMYWDDFGGRAFVERSSYTNGGWRYWFGWLQDGAEGERDFDAQAGALWPYLQGRGVEICPALNRASSNFKSKARGAAYGYGYNLLVGTRTGDGIRLATVRDPASVAIFADCAQINDFLSPASPEHPLLEEFYYFETNSVAQTVHFRHSGRALAWFADGHINTAPPSKGSLDTRLPPELVGLLDAQLVNPF